MAFLSVTVVRLRSRPFFFFNDTATTEIYTLSLHDALPIYQQARVVDDCAADAQALLHPAREPGDKGVPLGLDRKSTRLNSSHGYISYAVFCLKKKKPRRKQVQPPDDQSTATTQSMPLVQTR